MEKTKQVNEQWQEDAFFTLKSFVDGFNGYFNVDDVKKFAKDAKLPDPPSPKSWSAVLRRAVNEEVIAVVGNAPSTDPKAKGAKISVYEKI